MAAFGVPVAHEDDPARALRAALRMQRRLAELNGELADDHGVELAVPHRRQHRAGDGDHVAPAGRGDGHRRRCQRGGAAAAARRARDGPRGRAHRGRGARLRASRVEGSLERARQGATPCAAFRLVGERDEPRARRPRPARADRRPRQRARAARSVLRAGHRGGPRRTWSRSTATRVSARAGWLPSSRPPPDARVLRGPLPALRRRHHVLALRRDRQGARSACSTPTRPPTALAKVARARPESAPELAGSAPAIAHTIGLDDPDSPLRELDSACGDHRDPAGLARRSSPGRRGPDPSSSWSRTSTGPTARCWTCWRSCPTGSRRPCCSCARHGLS